MSVRAVACPCCWKTLYKVIKSPQGESRIEGPAIEEDAKGSFIQCVHCGNRIAVTKSSDTRDLSFSPAPNQHAGVGYLPFIE